MEGRVLRDDRREEYAGVAPFGGFHVALFGDFAQLPPILDTPLYATPNPNAVGENAQYAQDGHTLYGLLAESHCLRVIHRQQGDSEEQEHFRRLLRNASMGGLTLEDWKLLITRDQQAVTANELELFEDAMGLHTTRNAAAEVNLKELLALDRPCARIEAKTDGGTQGKSLTSEDAGGLDPNFVVACRAKVMITRNIWQKKGLVNGTIGDVEDVIWPPGAHRSDLPIAVLVSCKTYQGPTLWKTQPRAGYPQGVPVIPITPLRVDFEHNGKKYSRTQLPLRLAWAVTVHKSQGLTLGRVKIGLGKQEFANGLTFVALSRVKALKDLILLDRVNFSRVQKFSGKNLQQRLEDRARRYSL